MKKEVKEYIAKVWKSIDNFFWEIKYNRRRKERKARFKRYFSAIEHNDYSFTSELENKSVRELENMAESLNILYGSWAENYDTPTEKLLDFFLQLRVQKKDAQLNFSQENIDKISRLDMLLQDFFAKSKKEADSEIYRLREKMQKDNDIDSILVEFELVNIVFSEGNKSIFFGNNLDYDLFSSNPFFTGELNTPFWKTIYYKTDKYKSTEKSLAECWNEIPFFDLSTQHGISNHFSVRFMTDENNRKWVERIYDDSIKCTVGNAFNYIYEQGCYTLPEMLDIKEVWINVNNVGYTFKISL